MRCRQVLANCDESSRRWRRARGWAKCSCENPMQTCRGMKWNYENEVNECEERERDLCWVGRGSAFRWRRARNAECGWPRPPQALLKNPTDLSLSFFSLFNSSSSSASFYFLLSFNPSLSSPKWHERVPISFHVFGDAVFDLFLWFPAFSILNKDIMATRFAVNDNQPGTISGNKRLNRSFESRQCFSHEFQWLLISHLLPPPISMVLLTNK